MTEANPGAGARGEKGDPGEPGATGPPGPPGSPASASDSVKPVLEASAVVAHHISRDTAEQVFRRATRRVTLREAVLFLVLILALGGVIVYFELQHGSDQDQLKDRRTLNNSRINDLQGQLNELRGLVQELRASLLKAGVTPGDIPTSGPHPNASRAN